ncbi:MAG: fimbrillin family protein [Bacteroidales bacterium]|nr:fimbrillin family protein [Bacteroidales bacterium]
MKKINFTLIAGAIICMALACQKEVPTPVIPDSPDTPEVKTTVITAGFDNSKTELQPDKKVFWTDGDAISVNGVSSEAIALAAPAASASFTFNAVLSDEKKAVYPASAWTSDGTVTLSATQAAGTDASFAADALPMVAYAASGNELTFHHTAAVIKLQLKKGATSDNIDYVEFSGNNDEQVSGAFTVDYATGALTSTSSAAADKTLRVSVGKALSTTDVTCVYIAVPAIDFTNGFKMKVIDVNGVTMTKRVGAANLKKGGIYPTPVDTFDADNTLKAFAKSFVTCLRVWENTIGKVDADGTHNGANAWTNVHLLPIINPNKGYSNAGNQYDASIYSPFWSAKVGDVEYSSNQCWEIAIRGLMNLCTTEGEAFLTNMTNRNKAYTKANGLGMDSYIPAYSSNNKWNAYPWYESNNTVKFNNAEINEVDIEFTLKCCSWHVVRGLITNSGNTALGAIGNFQEFGNSSSTLILSGYVGYISPMRELLILARIYKYLLDNNINDNVYDALQGVTVDFALY